MIEHAVQATGKLALKLAELIKLIKQKENNMKARVKATGEIVEVMKICSTSTIWQSGLGNKAKLWNQSDLDFDIDSPVTIEGWVLRDDNNKIGIYRDKPTCDEDGYWDLTGECYDLFPDITPETEPKRYRITITPIEQ